MISLRSFAVTLEGTLIRDLTLVQPNYESVREAIN